MEKKIFNVLNKVGVPCNLKGRAYIETAIKIVAEKGNISTTKELYPEIARKHNTIPTRVERAILHAVACAFDHCDNDILVDIFGNTINRNSGKVTNQTVIYGIEKYLKINREGK